VSPATSATGSSIPSTTPAQNPAEDTAILAGDWVSPTDSATACSVVDPTGARRGPFVDADSGHPILVSPFHREAALCGTCHDVSNPAFEKDGNGNYVPNAFDARRRTSPRTSSRRSSAPTASGSTASTTRPKAYMRRSSAATRLRRDLPGLPHARRHRPGLQLRQPPIRDDLPLHDMTGGSTWLPTLMPTLHPGNPTQVDRPRCRPASIARPYMLQNAADLEPPRSPADD
jgi:hypothetical protein